MIMNKRLVWNFELSGQNLLDWQTLPANEKEKLRWEARFFWPEKDIILLHGLDDHFLELANYQIKQQQDTYFLLTQGNYNIKKRREQYVYKPLLNKSAPLCAYGKKIHLADFPAAEILPGTDFSAASLLAEMQSNSHKVTVNKEALIYHWASTPSVKLELARLECERKIYFSLSIEGRSKALVSKIMHHLLRKPVPCDYVSFLKRTLKLC